MENLETLANTDLVHAVNYFNDYGDSDNSISEKTVTLSVVEALAAPSVSVGNST